MNFHRHKQFKCISVRAWIENVDRPSTSFGLAKSDTLGQMAKCNAVTVQNADMKAAGSVLVRKTSWTGLYKVPTSLPQKNHMHCFELMSVLNSRDPGGNTGGTLCLRMGVNLGLGKRVLALLEGMWFDGF